MAATGEILFNERFQGDYWQVRFHVPEIAAQAKPGQFVHVRIPTLKDKILRRPFSICDVEGDVLTVVYKVVGAGTSELSAMKPGEACDLMGPLGTPYTLPGTGSSPIIVSGGYGAAATLLLAKRSPAKGILLAGARSVQDLILLDKYRSLGFEVRTATDDGSSGLKGFVTELLDDALKGCDLAKAAIYGCGPEGMLMALGRKVLALGAHAELSLDHNMCCGVGACFACVVKMKSEESPDGWRYARTCKEGPVFKAGDIHYG